jgi:type I restriction enzyme S subunit
MNPELLLAHFNRISDARGAILRLRSFILDLAVRGKVVEQDPNDEPASELLKRIQAEKARLVKSGVTRAAKPLAAVEDRGLFQLPDGWAWTRWDAIALKIGDIDHKMPETVADGVPFVSPRDFLPGNRIDFDGAKRVSFDDFARLSKKMRPAAGDLIYPRYGTIGENRLVTEERDFLVSYSCAVIKTLVGFISAQYQYLYSVSSFCREQATAAENKTTQANVGIKSIQEFVVPLPPLAEQHRIVTKVDELMALCDRLEATQRERETRRDRLTATGLHHLSDGATSETFREHAHFYLSHLPQLTIRPDQVPGLRQAILSLAVQGKLVRQSPDDEHAPTTPTTLPGRPRVRGMQDNLADEPWPNELPGSWRWHRLETISEQITDGEHATPPRIDEQQVPLVTAKNVRDGSMDYGNTDWVSYETAAKAWRRCRPSVGDLLLVCVGATTGRLCVLREPRDMVLVRSVALIRPTPAIRVDYLALVLRSPLSQKQIWEKVKVTAQPCLYINCINSLSIPLPPLPEQHRIVSKVDELMAVCDRLEAQLDTSQTETSRLLEAVLYHVLSPS